MGTPQFAVPTLEKLIDAGHEVNLVVTQPDRRGNRGKLVFSPVKLCAIDHGIEIAQPERIRREPDFIERLREVDADVIVVAAFGQILPKEVLELPRCGCLNVHGSLLPKYRGASPMQCAIADGCEETGVTIMRMDVGLDTGDMIAKASLPIDGMDITQLSERLSKLGAELLLEVLEGIEAGTVTYEKQDDSLATHCGMIKKTDGFTDFREAAEVLERKLRAYKEWPTLHSCLNGSMYKFFDAEVIDDRACDAVPGTVTEICSDSFVIKCGEGALRIKELQAEGKKRMKAADFLRGSKLGTGDVFGSRQADGCDR